jgi:DNA-binding beta-propeller fold protein YncE
VNACLFVRARRSAGAALLGAALLGAASVPGGAPPGGPAVRSLAGSGVAGNVDGTGLRAAFMYPAGVAYDPKTHAIYVADSAAQRVRMVSSAGAVTTVAGSGAALPSGLDVAGGYADGAALSARFSRPTAVAVAADGTVYVADSFNHCIRALKAGRVSTYAGAPSRPGGADGPVRSASFTEPRGLALGADGTLYVADFTVGIRAISPGGVVSTLALPAADFMSVALWERDGARVLFATSFWHGAVRFDVNTKAYDEMDMTVQHVATMNANGITALGPADALVSSTAWQNLTQVHFRPSAAGPPTFSSVVAGDDDRDTRPIGAFADGPARQARFYDPAGLATTPSGDVVVADGGNRRIRSISGLRALDEVGAGDRRSAGPKAALHIALVAGPSVNWNWSEDESLAGFLERQFDAHALRVTAVLTGDEAGEAQERSLETTLLDPFDLVVVVADPNFMRPGSERIAALGRLSDALAKKNVKLLVVEYPAAAQLGDAEETYLRLFGDAPPSGDASSFAALDAAVAALKVGRLNTLPAFARAELGEHRPLFASDQQRLSLFGNEFLAKLIAERVRGDGLLPMVR